MSDLLEPLSTAVEMGKINLASPFPPKLKGQPGADELCREALATGIPPEQILENALVTGMARIGERFGAGKAFVPEMLLAARAMTAAMVHLKPFFTSGQVKRKGVFVIGTVAGDLHDIGKNIVAMMIEGAGWEVVDLGVDVKADRLLAEIQKHPTCVVGLSALLTTTMVNMEKIVSEIHAKHPAQRVLSDRRPAGDNPARRAGHRGGHLRPACAGWLHRSVLVGRATLRHDPVHGVHRGARRRARVETVNT